MREARGLGSVRRPGVAGQEPRAAVGQGPQPPAPAGPPGEPGLRDRDEERGGAARTASLHPPCPGARDPHPAHGRAERLLLGTLGSPGIARGYGNGIGVKSQDASSHGQFAQVSSAGANVFSMLTCPHVASNLTAAWSR
ncbi:unnamed protein product [Coccothraustes coccothraustes]